MIARRTSSAWLLLFAFAFFTLPAAANNTPQTLPFSQNWTNIGLITVNDDWSGVPGIEGFRGDGLTAATGTNPQTILAADTPGVLDVNANQTNPSTFATGGANEFHIADPVVALAGSGTATAPYLKFYLNTTGQSGITIAYNVRDLDASTDNAIQQVSLQFRVGSSGNFTDVPAAYIADATTGPSLATLVTAVCAVLPAAADNQPLVEVRVMTTNAVGNDENIGIDDIVINTAGCGPPPLTLNVGDVTAAEGDPPGTTNFSFVVNLTAPAPPGGVSFNWQTADGTATLADNDYVQVTSTPVTIASGNTQANLDVTVNRDTTTEVNENFFVNITGVTNATAGDVQGLGTINNDDVTLTRIHDIQGPGASSPIVGSSVTTRGIVTGTKSNGYFIQEPDASVDADPATSEGIFVFTSGAPPAAAAMGNYVQVTGTVAEFVPSADPQQPPVTELTSPATVQLSTGNPLPTPIPLTATFPDPAGPHDQLERVEGMRVSAASITVSGPSDGSINEPNNTGTSNGRFHGVITGVARPFREPGIQAPDTVPVGSIPPIPRWDFNPERLRIESATLNAQPVLTVKSGDVVAPVTGVLDYGFRGYAIYPDGTLGTPVVTPGTLPTTVTTPTDQEFTVVSFNIFHFYDTINVGGSGPGSGDVVVTAGTYADRMNKASIAIRNNLKFPDIIGLQEVENLTVLQDLATKINNDAVANSQPNPMYVAYLDEGNDIGGIDVGFLVKTAPVTGAAPRVTVNSVVQIGAATTWTDPDDGNPALLNDRPSLVLDAVINRAPGVTFPVIVINNHLRSLIGIESNDPAGATTEGDRVRRKRQTQADFLAAYLQGRLTSNPNEHIVLVGDFNAFEFNDGFVDPINTIMGTPPPDNETVVCATCPTAPNTNDGVDQVNPDFTNLVNTPPAAERYSYNHEGNAQNIDHAIISAGLVADTTARRIEHPRINSDYPETERANASSPLRISDHDPVVAYFTSNLLAMADVSINKTDNVDPVNAGQNFFYTISVDNNGPDVADNVSWTDNLPVGTTFVSLSAPGGWSCSMPPVGANGQVSCSIASLAVGNAQFTVTVAVGAGIASGTVLSNTATVDSSSTDANTGNDSDTEDTTVSTSADLQISKTDTPDPVNAGSNLTYQITLTNNGPSNAANASFTDTLPAGTTFVSLSTTGSWSCTTPAVGAAGTVSCTNASFLVTVDFFTLVVNVNSSVAPGTILSNTASLSSPTTPDPNSGNNDDTADTTVTTSADVQVTKTDTPDPVSPGSNITYTITVTNAGPSDAASVTLADSTPANTTFVSLTQSGWSCTTPAVGGTGAINCSIATLANGGSSVLTLVVNVDSSTTAGTIISNTATATTTTTDPSTPNTATATTTVGSGSADLEILKADAPIAADPVTAGGTVTYTIVVRNYGPSAATTVSWTDTLPAGTTFQALYGSGVPNPVPASWNCTTPAVGATGTITCTTPSVAVTGIGSPEIFTLILNVEPSVANGTVLSNTATVDAATTDPNGANDSDTETTTVNTSADLQLTKTDTPDPVTAGSNITYTITVTNAGLSDASTVSLTDTLPANTTFVSLTNPGWSCTTPAVGAAGTVTCTIGTFPAGNAVFTLVVAVDAATPAGTIISNTATVSSVTTDPSTGNESMTTTTTTTAAPGTAQLSATKSVAGSFVPGGSVTYTVVITNNGTAAQPNNPTDEFVDVLPASLTLVSANANSGTANANIGTNTVTWNGTLAAGASVTITINATIDSDVTPGTTVSNQGTVNYDSDGSGDNDASDTTDNPATGGDDATAFVVSSAAHEPIPTLDEWALMALAAILGALAVLVMKK